LNRRDRAAIILAGGVGRRIRGLDKPLLVIYGIPMLKHVMDAISHVCDEIVVSVGNDQQRMKVENILCDATVVCDALEGIGPLEGIRQSCKILSRDFTAIVACDLPLLDAAVIEFLFNSIGPFDGAIPRWPDGKVEPLYSAFRTRALAMAVEEAIRGGKRRIMDSLRPLAIHYVPMEELAKIDPGLVSFLNVNDEGDLEEARRIASIRWRPGAMPWEGRRGAHE